MSSQLPTKVHLSPQALFRRMGEEAVVLNLADENYYDLGGEVGARMWELLSASDDPEAMIAALLTEYEVDQATLRRDIIKLLDDLAAAGLITVES